MLLTVIIIVKNEAENLQRCLQALDWVDEMIILDSGSTDETVSIAKTFTDKVFTTDWCGYGIQKQRALEKAAGKWVISLDADEIMTPELKSEILKSIQTEKYDAYCIPILLNFFDKQLYHSASPKKHIRLFKREGARFSPNIVHESISLPTGAKVGHLKGHLVHYSYQDVSHALQKMNAYSSFSAKHRLQSRAAPSFIKVVMGSWWMFFRFYFIQKGFLEGKAGFLLAVLSAQNSFYRGIKMIYQDRQ